MALDYRLRTSPPKSPPLKGGEGLGQLLQSSLDVGPHGGKTSFVVSSYDLTPLNLNLSGKEGCEFPYSLVCLIAEDRLESNLRVVGIQ